MAGQTKKKAIAQHSRARQHRATDDSRRPAGWRRNLPATAGCTPDTASCPAQSAWYYSPEPSNEGGGTITRGVLGREQPQTNQSDRQRRPPERHETLVVSLATAGKAERKLGNPRVHPYMIDRKSCNKKRSAATKLQLFLTSKAKRSKVKQSVGTQSQVNQRRAPHRSNEHERNRCFLIVRLSLVFLLPLQRVQGRQTDTLPGHSKRASPKQRMFLGEFRLNVCTHSSIYPRSITHSLLSPCWVFVYFWSNLHCMRAPDPG